MSYMSKQDCGNCDKKDCWVITQRLICESCFYKNPNLDKTKSTLEEVIGKPLDNQESSVV